jgi:hypothetical protein
MTNQQLTRHGVKINRGFDVNYDDGLYICATIADTNMASGTVADGTVRVDVYACKESGTSASVGNASANWSLAGSSSKDADCVTFSLTMPDDFDKCDLLAVFTFSIKTLTKYPDKEYFFVTYQISTLTQAFDGDPNS